MAKLAPPIKTLLAKALSLTAIVQTAKLIECQSKSHKETVKSKIKKTQIIGAKHCAEKQDIDRLKYLEPIFILINI